MFIGTRDERKLLKIERDEFVIRKEIAMRWTEVLEKDEEDDNYCMVFGCNNLLKEFVWEGPWLEGVEVLRFA